MDYLEELNNGIRAFQDKNFEDANSYFTYLMEFAPSDYIKGKAFLYHGVIRWLNSKCDFDTELAQGYIEVAYKKCPDIESARTLANIYYERGMFDKAVPLYEKGIIEKDNFCLIGLCRYYSEIKNDGIKTNKYAYDLYSNKNYIGCYYLALVNMGELEGVKKDLESAEYWAKIGIRGGINECEDLLKEIEHLKKNSGLKGFIKSFISSTSKEILKDEANGYLDDCMDSFLNRMKKR